jgi:uncharacterized YigZ family protein
MLFQETYRTIKSPSKGQYRDKGSRFIALAHPVTGTDQVKSLLDNYRKEYHDARHHCYAYLLEFDKSIWRTNDDGEPSGTAGKPILGQINSNDLTNILIVVIRYFGGTLLGISGLINAYKSAAADAIKNAEIIECTVKYFYRIIFPYTAMNEVMKIIKDENISQSEQVFELECRMKIGFRISLKEQILDRFKNIESLKMEFIERH